MQREPRDTIIGYQQSEICGFLRELESCGAEEAARRQLHGSGRLGLVIRFLRSEGLIHCDSDRGWQEEPYWKLIWKLTDLGRRFSREDGMKSGSA